MAYDARYVGPKPSIAMASLLKVSCFRAWPIYYHVQNLIRHVFCLFVMVGFDRKSFDYILSISLFSSHLCS